MIFNNHEHIHIVYDGPALAAHRMDVCDLAPALIAFSELLKAANRALNGTAADIQVEVSGHFTAGSFGVDLTATQQLLSQIRSLFAGSEATAVCNAFTLLSLVGVTGGGLIALLRRLGGAKPARIDAHGDTSGVWISETECIDVDSRIVVLYDDKAVRSSLEKVLSPLQREGITEFGVTSGDQVVLNINDKEIGAFRSIPQTAECASDTTVRKVLLVESIVFSSGVCLVHDGVSTYDVTIEDESFLARIEAGEPFGNADMLVVDLRQIQYIDDLGLITDSKIVKVLEHRHRRRQPGFAISTRNQPIGEQHLSH